MYYQYPTLFDVAGGAAFWHASPDPSPTEFTATIVISDYGGTHAGFTVEGSEVPFAHQGIIYHYYSLTMTNTVWIADLYYGYAWGLVSRYQFKPVNTTDIHLHYLISYTIHCNGCVTSNPTNPRLVASCMYYDGITPWVSLWNENSPTFQNNYTYANAVTTNRVGKSSPMIIEMN